MSEISDIERRIDELKSKVDKKKEKPVEFKEAPTPDPKPKTEPVKPDPKPDMPRLRLRRRKDKTEPEHINTDLDVLLEQTEDEGTTTYCPEAENSLEAVYTHPERFIEVNMVKRSRVVDLFYLSAEHKTFKYMDVSYNVDETGVYLLPKGDFFLPTSFYSQGQKNPVGFKQSNKGITGKALTLLYKHGLYETLLTVDEQKYNLFIVIFNLMTLIFLAIVVFMLFSGGGGGDPTSGGSAIPMFGGS